MRRVLLVLALLCSVTAACSSGDEDSARSGPRSSTTEAPGGSEEPTTSTAGEAAGGAETTTTAAAPASTVAPVPSPAPTTVRPAPAQAATPSCPAVPERLAPRADRSSYRLSLHVDLAAGVVNAEQAVRFTPDLPTDKVVFRLWANAPRITRGGGGIDVALDGASLTDPTTLVLPRALAAGETTEVSLTWRLRLPGAIDDRISRSGDAVRLGSFYPVVAWEPGVGWAQEPATSGFAEASTSVTADYDVTVDGLPEGVSVLASGVGDGAGRWRAEAVPDFALSLGRFALASGSARGGAVAVTVGVHAGINESPATYVDRLVRIIDDFSGRFGEYPWPSYTLAVTPQLPGGIEYPMHVMQGPGRIGRTTSHEVGHMWFYGLVANNQGRDPWIDEGLATYFEGRFEGTLASFQSREMPADGRGRLGEPMAYWETRQSSYYRSVYVQGANAISTLGPLDLVDCALRHVVARNAFRVAKPGDIVAGLSAVFPDAGEKLAAYGVRF